MVIRFVQIFCLYIIFIPAIGFNACKKNELVDEHPEFVQAIRRKIDNTPNESADEQLSFIDSSFKALRNPGTGDVFVKDSLRQYLYAERKQDYIKTLSCLDSMLVLIKDKVSDEKYAQRYAFVLYEKGQWFMNLRRYNESFHYISMAEDAVRTLVKNKCEIANYGSKIAYLMFAQEKYLESAKYFKKYCGLLLASCELDDYSRLINMQRCINNVGLSYLRAGLADSAALYESKALKLIEENEYRYPANAYNIIYQKSVIYGDQAEVLMIKEKYDEAEKLYKKSIEGTSVLDIPYTQITQIRLANLYLKQGKNEQAHELLKELKVSFATVKNEKQQLKWEKL